MCHSQLTGPGDGAQDSVGGGQALYQLSCKPSPILSLMLGTEHKVFSVLNLLDYRGPALLRGFPELLTTVNSAMALSSPLAGSLPYTPWCQPAFGENQTLGATLELKNNLATE